MIGGLRDNVARYGRGFVKGLLAQMAPDILKGALNELLRERRVGVKKASEWVQSNSSLWGSLDEGQKKALRKMGGGVNNLDWITSEWIIGAIRDEFPSVASLLIGWTKGANWLERQVEILKKESMGR